MSRLRYALALLVVGFILVMTLLPNAPAPSLPDIANVDKLMHAGAWGLLALVTFAPFFRSRALLCWLVLVAYGAAIEVLQSFVPPRSADVWDAVADAIGAALGVGVMLLWQRHRARRVRALARPS